jgi:hypothetical protein
MNYETTPRIGLSVADRHTERVGDESCVLAMIDRPADYSSAEGVEDDTTVELAFPGLNPSSRRNGRFMFQPVEQTFVRSGCPS